MNHLPFQIVVKSGFSAAIRAAVHTHVSYPIPIGIFQKKKTFHFLYTYEVDSGRQLNLGFLLSAYAGEARRIPQGENVLEDNTVKTAIQRTVFQILLSRTATYPPLSCILMAEYNLMFQFGGKWTRQDPSSA